MATPPGWTPVEEGWEPVEEAAPVRGAGQPGPVKQPTVGGGLKNYMSDIWGNTGGMISRSASGIAQIPTAVKFLADPATYRGIGIHAKDVASAVVDPATYRGLKEGAGSSTVQSWIHDPVDMTLSQLYQHPFDTPLAVAGAAEGAAKLGGREGVTTARPSWLPEVPTTGKFKREIKGAMTKAGAEGTASRAELQKKYTDVLGEPGHPTPFGGATAKKPAAAPREPTLQEQMDAKYGPSQAQRNAAAKAEEFTPPTERRIKQGVPPAGTAERRIGTMKRGDAPSALMPPPTISMREPADLARNQQIFEEGKGQFGGDRTTGHFEEGRGGLTDAAAGRIPRHPMAPAAAADVPTAAELPPAPRQPTIRDIHDQRAEWLAQSRRTNDMAQKQQLLEQAAQAHKHIETIAKQHGLDAEHVKYMALGPEYKLATRKQALGELLDKVTDVHGNIRAGQLYSKLRALDRAKALPSLPDADLIKLTQDYAKAQKRGKQLRTVGKYGAMGVAGAAGLGAAGHYANAIMRGLGIGGE
jgi:hypothetical protein